VTQAELARVVGISLSSLVRLDQGRRLTSPPLGWLVNCAIALGVQLEDVVEKYYLQ
jgi:DNA-binding XRE family transcriptional regulator